MEEEKREERKAKPEVRIDVNKHGIRRETYLNQPKKKPYRKDKEDK